MILSCQNVNKSFAEDQILREVSFQIEEHEKVAVVGINGAGKSTLLKIIVGEIEADSGSIAVSHDIVIGYLAQHQDITGKGSVYDSVLNVKRRLLDLEKEIRRVETQMRDAPEGSLDKLMKKYTELTHEFENGGGYAVKSEVTGVLKGLGFEEQDFERPVTSLSGGQKTRLALSRLLLEKPGLLLLDEPTNHLDLNAVSWLETYLRTYSGAVIVVTHDRYFLDHTVTRIVEIENGITETYKGTYSDYAREKAARRKAGLKAYLQQQAEIHHQEDVIAKLRSFNREKSVKRADSREKALLKIDRIERPQKIDSEMRLALSPKTISGKDVLTVEALTKTFPGLLLFENVSFLIRRGEHAAIIGDNGTGKTTLLKMINGIIMPDTGTIRLGAGVVIGYYDQEQQLLDPEHTIFEEIQSAYPDMNNTKVRNTLAAFLFTEDDVYKRINDLSGGEKGRVSLARLMLSDANFLILDEPTNHLDMVSREILETAINNYTGTVLYVSHDRYFINQTAHKILELSGNLFTEYTGNYDYYLENKEKRIFQSADAYEADIDKLQQESSSKQEWLVNKEKQAEIRKRERRILEAEEKIESLETRDSEIDKLLSLPENASNVEQYTKLANEKAEIADMLEEVYRLWETLQEDQTE